MSKHKAPAYVSTMSVGDDQHWVHVRTNTGGLIETIPAATEEERDEIAQLKAAAFGIEVRDA